MGYTIPLYPIDIKEPAIWRVTCASDMTNDKGDRYQKYSLQVGFSYLAGVET